MIAKTNVNMSTFEFGKKKIINIFVEGSSENSIDKPIVESIFKQSNEKIECKMVGFCTNVLAASELLYKENNKNYFIIDRDHNDDLYVNNTWTSNRKNNLIIWKKRHIENYFLDIDFFMKSVHLKPATKRRDLVSKLEKLANDRLYTDIVNLVIIKLREELKENWITKIKPLNNNTEELALQTLLEKVEFINFKTKANKKLSEDNIKDLFNYYKNEFSGGQPKLTINCGKWINLIEGKPILNEMLNTYCRIKKANNSIVSGNELKSKFLKDLMNNTEENDWPEDFKNLKQIILS